MTLLSKTELRDLVRISERPCVSLYLSAHIASQTPQQISAQFKALLRDAENQLAELGWWRPDVIELLKPAQGIDHLSFWQNCRAGLAVFIAPNCFRYYRLPLHFDATVAVGDRFCLAPLLPNLTGDGRFFILAFSQNQVKLFLCSRESISEIDLQQRPEDLQIALRHDEADALQPDDRATTKGVGLLSSGVSTTTNQDTILSYCQQLDTGLCELLGSDRFPLVLAGIGYITSIYRKANTYPHLLDHEISGNPNVTKPEDLHHQAWQIVQPYAQQMRQTAAERYRELAVADRASGKLQDVIPAAYRQHIETLFLLAGAEQWGHFDLGTEKVDLHDTAQTGDENLLDSTAIHTLAGGGTVYIVEPSRMPERTAVAAVFSYPVSSMQGRYQTAF
ncbi:hypothetical protein IQ268_17760 [Oculatella sp. LEGE 06141]|uniref:baeRF3 domain-containing protein n=1 Tax=Oculatella sp. LEGE 06141 TaxID=1828648 RepID=UPI001880CC85|nr:hypothetical protein [Oculatella sp. LEGE 06141]MBE9180410.1 hypothetical protein [Oculatella sp. LEGE 06141]